MAIDKKVEEAIYQAVKQNYQSDKLAQRLIQWLNDLSEGNASLSHADDRNNHIDNILTTIKIHNHDLEEGTLL